MAQQFPRTTVGGVSISRMVIGTNWMLGYSHRSPAADKHIRRRHNTPDSMADIMETFLRSGVDTILGPFGGNSLAIDAIKMAEDRVGRGMIIMDTPIINVDDTKEGRSEALRTIMESKQNGATFCMPHHVSVEQLLDKHQQAIPRLSDYLSMIREQGMLPGLSAHMPEVVIYSDMHDYDVETYIQIYNCMGFLMQVEVEFIHRVIHNAKKPVIAIKPMAAGRCTPFVGLTFSYNTIRDCDAVCLGCLTEQEAEEDIEIGLAALERRAPRLQGRDSPGKSQSSIIE